MAIFTFVVLTLWLVTWVSWFFCLPGTKWFDNQMKYESYDFDGLPFLIIASLVALAGAVAGLFYALIIDADIGLGILAVVLSGVALVLWFVSFAAFGLSEYHQQIRKKRNY